MNLLKHTMLYTSCELERGFEPRLQAVTLDIPYIGDALSPYRIERLSLYASVNSFVCKSSETNIPN